MEKSEYCFEQVGLVELPYFFIRLMRNAKWQLKQLWWMLDQNVDKIVDALHSELNRHAFETLTLEMRGVKADIVDMLEHIDEWSAGDRPDAGFLFGTLGRAWLRKEPLGVSFIISAWNFPLYTLLSPMVAALAAGKSTASVLVFPLVPCVSP